MRKGHARFVQRARPITLRVFVLLFGVVAFCGRSGAAQLDMVKQPRAAQVVFSGEKTNLSLDWRPNGEGPTSLKTTLVQLTSGHRAVLWKGRELAVLLPDEKAPMAPLEIPTVESETQMELYWAAYEGERLVVSTTMYPLVVLPPRPKARTAFAAAVRSWLDSRKLEGVRVGTGQAEMEQLFKETHLGAERVERALALVGAPTQGDSAASPVRIRLLRQTGKLPLAVYDSHAGEVRWPTSLADAWDEALFLHQFPALLNTLDEFPNKDKK